MSTPPEALSSRAGIDAGAASSRRWSTFTGRLSAGFGVLCGLHCAAVPIVVFALPSLHLGLHRIGSPEHELAMALLRSLRYEAVLLAVAAALAALSLGLGTWRHRRWSPWLGWLAAVLAFTLATQSAAAHRPLLHALCLLAGSLALGLAHHANHRAWRA
jgi:uncharacterized membrane protein (DUF2068 family)